MAGQEQAASVVTVPPIPPEHRADCGTWLGWMLVTTIGWAVADAMFWTLTAGVAAVSWAVDQVISTVLGGFGEWLGLRHYLQLWARWRALTRTVGWIPNLAMRWSAVGAVAGALAGFGQWLILRRHFRRAGWWILATVIGWAVARAVAETVNAALDVAMAGGVVAIVVWAVAGAMAGALAGFGHWLILRRHFQRAGWWILANAIGWVVARAASWMGVGWAMAIAEAGARDMAWAIVGAAFGAISGGLTGAVLISILHHPLNASQ